MFNHPLILCQNWVY